MIRTQLWESSEIALVETPSGELTLSIEGEQAMQAWEKDLMWLSADMLCSFGSEFLEVGLGLGISALRIAGHPGTRKHTVVERHQRVIDLFRERHPEPPASLHIVRDDAFRHFLMVPPASLDGIFFDPFMPAALENQKSIWDEFMPLAIAALRPGGAFIPFFATDPILKWPFFHYFDQIAIRKHSYSTPKEHLPVRCWNDLESKLGGLSPQPEFCAFQTGFLVSVKDALVVRFFSAEQVEDDAR